MAKEERRFLLDIESSVLYMINFDADEGKIVGIKSASQGRPLVSSNAPPMGGVPGASDELPFGQTTYCIDPTGERPFELYTVVWPSKDEMEAGKMPHMGVSMLPRDLVKAGLATWPKTLRTTEQLDVENDAELKTAMKTINDLIGLNNVKEDLSKHIAMARFARAKERAFGKPGKGNKHTAPSLHLVFTGNPGTGKTTVAREYAKVLHALGFIRKPEVIEVQRTDLVAGFVGQTALKTREVLKKAMGGVLFIDEAYALTLTSSDKDFGREAIAEIVSAMENNRDNLVVIVAGYPEPMKNFINANEGLKSRFLNYITFENYGKDDLSQIMDFMLKERGYTIEPEARTRAIEMLDADRKVSGDSFGNGRTVRNLVDKAEQNLALRLDRDGKLQKDNGLTQDQMKAALSSITLEDVSKVDLSGVRSIKKEGGLKSNFGWAGSKKKAGNDNGVIRPSAPMLDPAEPKKGEDDLTSRAVKRANPRP